MDKNKLFEKSQQDPFAATGIDPFTTEQDQRTRHIKHSNKHSDFVVKWTFEKTDEELNRDFSDDAFECSFRNPADWQINHKGDREL